MCSHFICQVHQVVFFFSNNVCSVLRIYSTGITAIGRCIRPAISSCIFQKRNNVLQFFVISPNRCLFASNAQEITQTCSKRKRLLLCQEMLTTPGVVVRSVAPISPISSNVVTVMRCPFYLVSTTVPNVSGVGENVQLG